MSEPSPRDLIARKRSGRRLDPAQLAAAARGIADGSWSEAQIGAFAMAVAWRGMQTEECRDFTLAMRDSGSCLDWRHLPGPVLDKHSTGGVGDSVSLLLAPLLAACGGYVPMISGRGLGHTGGTLDKLESLPGYDIHPSAQRLREVVASVGCAIVGQDASLVPADRRLYAVRDVTATVDVIDLMVSSILAKKLAGGASAWVLDVKSGSGAQLADPGVRDAFVARIAAVARACGLTSRIAISDMDQVLGDAAGNALEVAAVLDILRGGQGSPRLRALSLALAAELLCLGGLAVDTAEANRRLVHALDTGAAAETFARMVVALGGPQDLLERTGRHLPGAPVQRVVAAPVDGFVGKIDVRALGDVVVRLGGGRQQPDQAIDHAVGLSAIVGLGERRRQGEPLALVHARSDAAAEQAVADVQRAFVLADAATALPPLLRWYAESPEHACAA